jgi:tripartite-type tricarboxylate transporter receptor subunit TctC
LVPVTPIVVMAHPSFPAKTIAELIALGRRDGKLDAGAPPPGTENYLAAELFRAMTGLDITIVTYKGTGPLTNDLVGGHIQPDSTRWRRRAATLRQEVCAPLQLPGRCGRASCRLCRR